MACRKLIRDKEDISKQAKQAKNKVFESKQVEVEKIAEDPIEPFQEDGESKGPPTILEMLRIRNQEILGRVGNTKGKVRHTNKPKVKKGPSQREEG
eukprot:4345208-Heterocapsa_arctica.AAC.1